MNIFEEQYVSALGRELTKRELSFIKMQKLRYLLTLENGSVFRYENPKLLQDLLNRGENTNSDMVAESEKDVPLGKFRTFLAFYIRPRNFYSSDYFVSSDEWFSDITFQVVGSPWTWFVDCVGFPCKNELFMESGFIEEGQREFLLENILKDLFVGVTEERLEKVQDSLHEELEQRGEERQGDIF